MIKIKWGHKGGTELDRADALLRREKDTRAFSSPYEIQKEGGRLQAR